jgi:microcystin-dependent protein
MANQFLGEIRMFAGNFAISGWAMCNGQILPITQNTALFSLLGTTYGGDGKTTFALPDLRSRVPIHMGTGVGLSSYVEGQTGGAESVILASNQIPAHTHSVNAATTGGNQASPANGFPAVESTGTSLNYSSAASSNITMNASMIAANSGGQPHENRQPFLAVNFIIALQGIFPSRN